MAEEDQGFYGTFARQVFRTHRAFRSVIMDSTGTPVLWVRSSRLVGLKNLCLTSFNHIKIHRPFSWINSRIYVQRKVVDPNTGLEEQVVTLGEAQQEWHLWRRRYNVFTG